MSAYYRSQNLPICMLLLLQLYIHLIQRYQNLPICMLLLLSLYIHLIHRSAVRVCSRTRTKAERLKHQSKLQICINSRTEWKNQKLQTPHIKR